MAHKQVQVVGKRATWATQFKVETLRGKPLMPNGMAARRYFDTLDKYITRMEREVKREVARLFMAHAGDSSDGVAFAMDASIASQARIVSNAMRSKFAAMFAKIAQPTAQQMVDMADKNSATGLGISLKEMSGQLTLKTDVLNGPLRDILSASVTENVGLIRRIPEKYLDNVTGSVMRSIQTGNGLADLQPQLDAYGVTVRNWAKNVSLDQTRKAYNGLAAGRMKALGVKKFEWVHSQGSNHPRIYHKETLNGKIFSFDDLPHLDGPSKGEKGIPGQAPFCRCTMRPIFDFSDDDD